MTAPSPPRGLPTELVDEGRSRGRLVVVAGWPSAAHSTAKASVSFSTWSAGRHADATRRCRRIGFKNRQIGVSSGAVREGAMKTEIRDNEMLRSALNAMGASFDEEGHVFHVRGVGIDCWTIDVSNGDVDLRDGRPPLKQVPSSEHTKKRKADDHASLRAA